MKIHQLRFKNINSLKGEFCIDFDRPEFTGAGLFAITGPTGAGKTTLLDAITLALYSYTARMDKVTEASMATQNAIMTRGMKDSYAEIIFSVGNNTYQSHWSVRTTSKGNLDKIKLKISQKQGEVFIPITDKVSESKAEIVTITGLTQEQFSQAIVLSQGKFDEFLRADKHDRYKLLEIITGTGLFRQIGMSAFNRMRDIQQQIRQHNAVLDNVKLLSAGEIAILEAELESLQAEELKTKERQSTLNKLKATKERIQELKSSLGDIDVEMGRLAQKQAEMKPEGHLLERHNLALPYADTWREWLRLDGEIKREEGNVEWTTAEIVAQQKILATCCSKLHETTGKAVEEADFINSLEAFYAHISQLDNACSSSKSLYDNRREPMVRAVQLMPASLRESLKNMLQDTGMLRAYKAEQQAILQSKPLPPTLMGKDLRIAADASRKRIAQLQVCEALHQQVQEIEKSMAVLLQEKGQYETDIQQIKSAVAGVQATMADQQLQAAVLQKAVEVNKAVMALEIHRSQLKKGEPCPCCGSLEHPYTQMLPPLNDALEREWNQQVDGINRLDEDLKSKERELLVKETKLSVSKTNIEQLSTQKTNVCDKLQAGMETLDSKDLDTDMLQGMIHQEENMMQLIDLHEQWEQALQHVDSLIEGLESLHESKQEWQARVKEREEAFGESDINHFRNNLMTAWLSAQEALQSKGLERDRQTAALLQWKEAYAKQEKRLMTAIQSAGFLDPVDFSNSLLDPTKAMDISNRINGLAQSINTLQGKKAQSQQQLEAIGQQDDAHQSWEALIVDLDAASAALQAVLISQGEIKEKLRIDGVNRSMQQGLIAELDKLSADEKLYRILNEYIGDAEGNKFNNIVQRITMRHLFELANERLLVLMDRYRLELGTGKNEDEIWVVDSHMGNTWRSIDSVSGGERFVISLALALALSDMASQNVRIDSLFIDEGFGSLSPDDLYNAINMLERMQVESNKLVGIISHVESLKERIATQIVVSKLHNGESTLHLKDGQTFEEMKIA